MVKMWVGVVIGALVASMFVVLIVFDIQQIIITPLSVYGVNHWIPEFFVLVGLGFWITRNLGKFLAKVIAGCVLLYATLTYFLMSQPASFSIGSGCFFVAAMVLGIWIGVKRRSINES